MIKDLFIFLLKLFIKTYKIKTSHQLNDYLIVNSLSIIDFLKLLDQILKRKNKNSHRKKNMFKMNLKVNK